MARVNKPTGFSRWWFSQEIVSRGGWTSGNAVAFVITGSGARTAESVDRNPAAAPKLIIEFSA